MKCNACSKVGVCKFNEGILAALEYNEHGRAIMQKLQEVINDASGRGKGMDRINYEVVEAVSNVLFLHCKHRVGSIDGYKPSVIESKYRVGEIEENLVKNEKG